MNQYFLSFIQIITESLPISSSGHITLYSTVFNQPIDKNFIDFLHAPTCIIICIYFWRYWTTPLLHLSRYAQLLQASLVRVVAADLITILMYFAMPHKSMNFPLWLGFLISFFLLFSLFYDKKNERINSITNIPLGYALLIGFIQGIALLPGISRLGATFVCGRWLGLSSKVALLFSMTIAWPLMFAGFLKGAFCMHLHHASLSFNLIAYILLISCISYHIFVWTARSMYKNKISYVSYYLLIPAIIAFIYGT